MSFAAARSRCADSPRCKGRSLKWNSEPVAKSGDAHLSAQHQLRQKRIVTASNRTQLKKTARISRAERSLPRACGERTLTCTCNEVLHSQPLSDTEGALTPNFEIRRRPSAISALAQGRDFRGVPRMLPDFLGPSRTLPDSRGPSRTFSGSALEKQSSCGGSADLYSVGVVRWRELSIKRASSSESAPIALMRGSSSVAVGSGKGRQAGSKLTCHLRICLTSVAS
mmetsp:Transcript_4079/g.10391  ORF Transcript_4079/g.10391 Transcript_4079/m.10391 type:complete len:225 (-) Transcript_4079:471-1145(-)